jgi:hypothetical protein
MPHPIRALRDWSQKKKLAAAMYDTLRRRGRPGGLDVSKQDAEHAAALMYLLEQRTDVTVVKNKTNLTLMFKEDVTRVFGAATHAIFDRSGITATPGEDLVDE